MLVPGLRGNADTIYSRLTSVDRIQCGRGSPGLAGAQKPVVGLLALLEGVRVHRDVK